MFRIFPDHEKQVNAVHNQLKKNGGEVGLYQCAEPAIGLQYEIDDCQGTKKKQGGGFIEKRGVQVRQPKDCSTNNKRYQDKVYDETNHLILI